MSETSRLAVAAMVLGSYGGGLAPAAAAQEPFRLSVDVDLVVLHATMRSRQGRPVAGLSEKDVEVYENGVRQTIRVFQHEDTPVTVGLVVDHSRSMLPKLPQVVAAAEAFVRSSNPQDQMFVVDFSDGVSLGLPNGVDFTNNAAEIKAAVAHAPAPGMTSLYDGVLEGLEKLQSGQPEKKALLVISDGGDNASAHRLADVLAAAQKSDALIYAIGLFDERDPDRDPGALKRLARETGGQAFFPEELGAAKEICENIAREIRTQYTIGYVPKTPPAEGSYRAIRVTARTPDGSRLVVRTRAGYIAAPRSVKSGGAP